MTRDTTADADVMVERPPHYHGVTRAGRRIEVIDVIEGYGLGYHLGNAVKYLCRAGRKTCDPRRDLGKARWYVRRAAERVFALPRAGLAAVPAGRRPRGGLPEVTAARFAVLHVVRRRRLCVHAHACAALGISSGVVTLAGGARGLDHFAATLATDAALAARVAAVEAAVFPTPYAEAGVAP